MKFMDLLFSKYASPFSLLDGYISTGRFLEFVINFVDTINEDQLWEVWLHKCIDKSFNEFKMSIMLPSNQFDTSSEALETTLKESKSIILNFTPKE